MRDLKTIKAFKMSCWVLRACLHGGGGPQVGEVIFGESPHKSCKRDHMYRRVTPPKRVTLPNWGTPPPCKLALRLFQFIYTSSHPRHHLNENLYPWVEDRYQVSLNHQMHIQFHCPGQYHLSQCLNRYLHR